MPSFFVHISPSASSSRFCSREKAFLMFLFPALLPYVPSDRSWKIPSFPPSLKEPRRAAWKVISNYSIAHSMQWKHQQFIRQRGPDQMDHQLLSFGMSGSSLQSDYLMLALSLYLTNRSTLSMDNGLHPAKKLGYVWRPRIQTIEFDCGKGVKSGKYSVTAECSYR